MGGGVLDPLLDFPVRKTTGYCKRHQSVVRPESLVTISN